MVKNAKLLEKFEKERLKKDKLSLEKKYKILDAMYKEVVILKKSKTKNTREKDRIIYKIAKVINSV
jgi:hypothetical protein